MAASDVPVLTRMTAQIVRWEACADQRAVFLACYCLMTRNTLGAVTDGEFADPVWVGRLLDCFADYYFVALDAYERDPAAAPKVWQIAYHAARDPDATALQRLLLGVSAHINYDLVLTLVDLLDAEWSGLSPARRAARYADFRHVNAIIGRTIDAVQDQVLEPAMPIMALFDQLLGPVDELLVSRLITGWRENVWRHAVALLDAADATDRARGVARVEDDALHIARRIRPQALNA